MAKSTNISRGVAKSWENPETAAARNKKDGCELDGVYFSSTEKAWKTTEHHRKIVEERGSTVSDSQCITFRGRLKKAGELNELGHHWKIVPRRGQKKAVPTEIMMPTSNMDEYETRSSILIEEYPAQLLSTPPAGQLIPQRNLTQQTAFVRDPRVRAYVILEANGHCECCKQKAPFTKADGTAFLEVHHLVTLADGGPDTIDNSIAACPNCHRELHHGADRTQLIAKCYSQIERLRRPR